MAPACKRIFPVLILALMAASCLCAYVRKRNTKYYTVLDNSPAVLRCDFPKKVEYPQQVMWVKGKISIMSLDGEDFHTMAERLDPKMAQNYRLEAGEDYTSLIIPKAYIANPDVDHPGLYKCVVDNFYEQRYELSVVKNDLRCIVKNSDQIREPALVGTKLLIHCSVTKDRVPKGSLNFTLLLDGVNSASRFVSGKNLYDEVTNVAKVNFTLDLTKALHGKRVEVRLEINEFDQGRNEEEMPKVGVVEKLRLTHGFSVDCPKNQLYIVDSVARADAHIAGQVHKVMANYDEASQALPIPYCDVASEAHLSFPYRVDWVSRDNDTEVAVSFIDENTGKIAEKYRVYLEKKHADAFAAKSQSRLRLSIADFDSSSVFDDTDLDFKSSPYLSCRFKRDGSVIETLSLQVGPESDLRSFVIFCQVISAFDVKSVMVKSPTRPILDPAISVSLHRSEQPDEVDADERPAPSFEISFLRGNETANEEAFFDSFIFPPANDVEVDWKAQALEQVEARSEVEEEVPEPKEQLENSVDKISFAKVSSVGTASSINKTGSPEYEDKENQMDATKSTATADLKDMVGLSENTEDDFENAVGPVVDASTDLNTLTTATAAAEVTNLTSADVDKELESKSDGKQSLSRTRRDITDSDDEVAFKISEKGKLEGFPRVALSVDIVYQAGPQLLYLAYKLPVVSVNYAPSLLCDETASPTKLPFAFHCSYPAIPNIDFSRASVFASPEFAGRLFGRFRRTADGFSIDASVLGDKSEEKGSDDNSVARALVEELRGRKENLAVRVETSDARVLQNVVALDFSDLEEIPLSALIVAGKEPEVVISEPGKQIPGSNGKGGPVKRPGEDEPKRGGDVRTGEIGKSAQQGGADGFVGKMMKKDWFLPVVGAVGGVVCLALGVAVYAGMRRRARDDAPARMDAHIVGDQPDVADLPDEDDDGYAAKPVSVAHSEMEESGETWLREPGGEEYDRDQRNAADDVEAARYVDNANSSNNNNNSSNSLNYSNCNNNNLCDVEYESEDDVSMTVQDSYEGPRADSMESLTPPDIRDYDGVCRYDDSGVCRFGDAALSPDHTWLPSAESLIVPDHPPTPIKYSAIKAMQSFPANVALTPTSRKTPAPPAEVDV